MLIECPRCRTTKYTSKKGSTFCNFCGDVIKICENTINTIKPKETKIKKSDLKKQLESTLEYVWIVLVSNPKFLDSSFSQDLIKEVKRLGCTSAETTIARCRRKAVEKIKKFYFFDSDKLNLQKEYKKVIMEV